MPRTTTRASKQESTEPPNGALRAQVRLVHVLTVPLSLHFLKGQARYIGARGYRMRVVTSPGEGQASFSSSEGVPASSVPMPRSITPLGDLVAVWRILRLLRRERPHIVHAGTPKGGLLGTMAAWLARVPVRIYHIRGLPYVTATGARRTLLRATEKLACALATQVLCVSHSIREQVIQEGICPPRKVTVLLSGSSNGVDARHRFDPARTGAPARRAVRENHGIPPDALVIGFMGRLVRDKGLMELAGAWRILREEFPALHLLIVGMFEPQDPVPPDVEAMLRTDPHIHLTGTQWDTPPYYAAMDILCLPTYREGFPNVPLEAAAMALPVVSTRVPGCTDAVRDGVTGVLVPARDAGALADALRTYLRDADLRHRHGQAGRDRVLAEFQQETLWNALCQEYHRLLGEKGLPVPEPDPNAVGTPVAP